MLYSEFSLGLDTKRYTSATEPQLSYPRGIGSINLDSELHCRARDQANLVQRKYDMENLKINEDQLMNIVKRLATTNSAPRLAGIIPFVAVFAAGLSSAQADAPSHGSDIVQTADLSDRHDGFFLRMATAPAVLGSQITYANGDVQDIEGNGLQAELSIGGAIAENLILHADFLVSAAFKPTGEFNGASFDYDDNELLGFSAFGVGLTYYIMPYDLYVSGSIISTSVAVVDADNGDDLMERTRWT